VNLEKRAFQEGKGGGRLHLIASGANAKPMSRNQEQDWNLTRRETVPSGKEILLKIRNGKNRARKGGECSHFATVISFSWPGVESNLAGGAGPRW